ncbi:hypothetical protein ABT258_37670 [Streptomyces tendae]|uniref:hypothetical protein n=1 Tax=Streptomyces tendae TaxID=1932 RepID=UPI0033204186
MISGLTHQAVGERSAGRISAGTVSRLLNGTTVPTTWGTTAAYLAACGVPDGQIRPVASPLGAPACAARDGGRGHRTPRTPCSGRQRQDTAVAAVLVGLWPGAGLTTGNGRGRGARRRGSGRPPRVVGLVGEQRVPSSYGHQHRHHDHARGRLLPLAGSRRRLHIMPSPVIPLTVLRHSYPPPLRATAYRAKSPSARTAPAFERLRTADSARSPQQRTRRTACRSVPSRSSERGHPIGTGRAEPASGCARARPLPRCAAPAGRCASSTPLWRPSEPMPGEGSSPPDGTPTRTCATTASSAPSSPNTKLHRPGPNRRSAAPGSPASAADIRAEITAGRTILSGCGGYSQGRGSACHRALSQ